MYNCREHSFTYREAIHFLFRGSLSWLMTRFALINRISRGVQRGKDDEMEFSARVLRFYCGLDVDPFHRRRCLRGDSVELHPSCNLLYYFFFLYVFPEIAVLSCLLAGRPYRYSFLLVKRVSLACWVQHIHTRRVIYLEILSTKKSLAGNSNFEIGSWSKRSEFFWRKTSSLQIAGHRQICYVNWQAIKATKAWKHSFRKSTSTDRMKTN